MSHADRRLFQSFGSGPAQVPADVWVHRAVERWARQTPSAVAVEHDGQALTYAELDAHSRRLAMLLVERGVRPGDSVALFTVRSIPMVVGLLASLKVGAAYVPQDVRIAPPAQLEHVLRTTGAPVVLTTAEFAGGLPVRDGLSVIAVDEVMAGTGGTAAHTTALPDPEEFPPDLGCYVLFTSGTTGRPNGVIVTHRNVCNLILTQPGDLGVGPGWRIGQILNIGFDMAAWEILVALTHGATLVVRGADIARTAADVDVLISTPSILARLDPERCPRIRVVAVAGEPCPRTLADRWAAVCTFYNGCGPTEVTIVNTMQRHDPSARLLTIGRPTPNNTVYVLDERRLPCAIGEVGEMWAGGDCVSAGYLGNPELTSERYAADPFLGGGRMMFRTRDLGRWTADGELEHLGRTDDQVKVRGFRVELDSVSAVLERLPGCRRAVTLKANDTDLVSFVSPASLDVRAAREAVAAELPYYCVPAAVHAVEELPTTDRGKIDKSALLRLVAEGLTQLPAIGAADAVTRAMLP